MDTKYWEGERRLIFGLGHMSYKLEGVNLRRMHLRILTPPAHSMKVEKIEMIQEMLRKLYGNPAYEADYTMNWIWRDDEIYIHILLDFDEEIRDPQAFALSQLFLIRWEWSLAKVKAYLKFYLVYVSGYTEEFANEKIEELLNPQLIKDMRKFGWVEILPDAANAGRYYTMQIIASSFGNDEMTVNIPVPKRTFTISFWDYQLP